MDLNIKRPTHIFALLAVLLTMVLLIIIPLLYYIETSTQQQYQKIEINDQILLASSIITVLILTGTPLVWYIFVNKASLKEIITYHLGFRKEKIDKAILWGITSAVSMLIIVIIISNILSTFFDVNPDDLQNVKDLAKNVSLSTLLFIILIQSISEEIFFRGFLLEKIKGLSGEKTAILTTAILFGIAHLSYGKIYLALMPAIMGVILGFTVVKTKNLFSTVTAHILFNLTSLILFIYTR